MNNEIEGSNVEVDTHGKNVASNNGLGSTLLEEVMATRTVVKSEPRGKDKYGIHL